MILCQTWQWHNINEILLQVPWCHHWTVSWLGTSILSTNVIRQKASWCHTGNPLSLPGIYHSYIAIIRSSLSHGAVIWTRNRLVWGFGCCTRTGRISIYFPVCRIFQDRNQVSERWTQGCRNLPEKFKWIHNFGLLSITILKAMWNNIVKMCCWWCSVFKWLYSGFDDHVFQSPYFPRFIVLEG